MTCCDLSSSTKGNQYKKNPQRKMMSVRLKILPNTCDWLIVLHFFITKLMAFPTAKRNEGNTRSVGVKPCQAACSRGEYVNLLPDVFTIIIKQIVIPLNTSRARN